VLQDEAAVYEVIRRGFQTLAGDVMAAHLDRCTQVAQALEVDIGRHNRSRCTDPVTEPSRDRSAAGPDLQTAPPLADTGRFQMLDRERVTGLSNVSQPSAFAVRLGPTHHVAVDPDHCTPRHLS
jgi:hypothetical protein